MFKSTNYGKSWKIISPDLSTRDPDKTKFGQSGGITPDNTGAETHCAVTTLSISTIDEQIVWAGTDDGMIHLTTNGGHSWASLRDRVPGVPNGIWVSRLEASHFRPERAYLTFDGHRSDHFAPHVFVTDDYGATWNSLVANLPSTEVVRVIREDLINENLLFIGTETGVWMSLNRGQSWQKLTNGFPTVSVYDLAIHPRDHDLIVGTHGRSIWVLEDISPLQQSTDKNLAQTFHLFDQRDAILWENKSRGGQRGHFWFAGDNPAAIRPTSSIPRAAYDVDALIAFHNGSGDTIELKLTIQDQHRNRLDTLLQASPGINRYRWNRLFNVEPYTTEEMQLLESFFEKLMAQYNSNLLRRTYDRFKNASNTTSQRSIIQSLMEGFLRLPIDPGLGLPKAGAGTYKITLEDNQGSKQTKTLLLKEDPLKE